MAAVFQMIGSDVSEYGNSKQYCPFGHLYHADGGTSKSLRVYTETETAFCFAGCGWFNPVRLLSLDRGISEEEAADVILDHTGYVPPDLESRWTAATTITVTVDKDALSEALKVACGRMDPDWEDVQFDPPIATKFRLCLELLPRVRDEGEATKWLAITKQIMSKTLGEHRGE
jgi:hypothetical protein